MQLQEWDQLGEEGLVPLRPGVAGRLPRHQQGLLELQAVAAGSRQPAPDLNPSPTAAP